MAIMTREEEARELVRQAYNLTVNGKLNDAVEMYRKAIRLHPTAEAHTFLGWAYSHLREYKRAIAECETAIALDPDFGNPWNDIGAYLMQLSSSRRSLEEAVPYLKRAMTAKRYATPHFPHYNYGRILERQGDWFGAIVEYKASLNLQPNYTMAKDAFYRLQALLN